MRYQLAIFDFDGTLADSFPWFTGVVNRLADKHGFRTVDDAEIERLRAYDTRRIVEYLGVPAWRLPWIARDARRLMSREIDSISLFPGVRPALRELTARGMTLAIVSSNSARNVRGALGSPTADLIEHYACKVGVFGKRPKLRRVLRRSGVPRDAAIYIGDEIRDLKAARAERLAFGAVAWGYTKRTSLERLLPDHVFATAEEIVERLAHAGP